MTSLASFGYLLVWLAIFIGFLLVAGWIVGRLEDRDVKSYEEWEREKRMRDQFRGGRA